MPPACWLSGLLCAVGRPSAGAEEFEQCFRDEDADEGSDDVAPDAREQARQDEAREYYRALAESGEAPVSEKVANKK